MRGSKIEQLGLAHRDGFRQFVDIEAAAEGGNHRRHVLLVERNRAPLEALARTFDTHFTQTPLPDYIAEKKPAWASKVVFDARGHFAEPHGETEIGLGTLEVRGYVADIRGHRVNGFTPNVCEDYYPTCGPRNRFGAILFL